MLFRHPQPALALLDQLRSSLPAIDLPVRRLTVELTKYCSVGCSFCKYNAPLPRLSEKRPSLYLGREAIDACLRYVEAQAVEEVVLTGGGEPTHELETVLRIVEEGTASLFSLYTAGQWGATKDETIATLCALQTAVSRRSRPAHVRIRLSLDRFHQEKIGLQPALNIIAALTDFPDQYPNVCITVRTVIGHDQPIAELAGALGARIEIVDQHLRRLVMPSGTIDVLALNLIPTGRYNSRTEGQPDLADFRTTLSGLQSHLGAGWPLIYADGLNIGVRPTGKVYLYGATAEDQGRIPQVALATAVERIARDPISHALRLKGIVSFFDALASCEEEIVTRTAAHHEPSLLIPKFCEDSRSLLLAKILALILISESVDGAPEVLNAVGFGELTTRPMSARLASLAAIYKEERNGWKQADNRRHLWSAESSGPAD